MKSATGIFFDLDGTLADTAPDMAAALNRLLAENGRRELALSTIRPHVSKGAGALIRLGFDLSAEDPAGEALRARFMSHYAESLCRHTSLFPGMPAVLEALDRQRRPWGVVTNKPARLAEPLLATLGLGQRLACLVCGDTAARPKPDPAPVLLACERLGLEPRRCVMVGDDERDVISGRRAGAATLVALFGYLGDGEDPYAWGADGYLNSAEELLDWLH